MDNPPTSSERTNMFQAGISSKFTQKHTVNFQDTSLNAASAAKVRAEKKMERQAEAIEKQQKKIEVQMKKFEDLTQKVQRQQMREAKRLRNRLSHAASRIQRAYRRYHYRKMILHKHAAIQIQTKWRTYVSRTFYLQVQAKREELRRYNASRCITKNLRKYVCRCRRKQNLLAYYQAATMIQGYFRIGQAKNLLYRLRVQKKHSDRINHAATVIQANVRCYMTRLVYLDVLYLICRIQAVMRGHLCRKHLRIEKLIDQKIVCKVQAMVRGMLLRKRLPKLRKKLLIRKQKALKQAQEIKKAQALKRPSVLCVRPTGDKITKEKEVQPKSPSTEDEKGVVKLRSKPKKNIQTPIAATATKVTATAKTIATTAVVAESVAENRRSFWLPSGSNAVSNRRLPILPRKSLQQQVISETHKESHSNNNNDNNNYIDEAVQHSQQLQKKGSFVRKRHQKNRPTRLNPVSMSVPVMLVPTIVLPTMAVVSTSTSKIFSSSSCRDSNHDHDGRQEPAQTEEETNQMLLFVEEKMKKEKELKQKLLQQKKMKQEIQDKRKREIENEFLENRLMEKEEKLIRLYVKFLQRRSMETKSKKKTIVQQREEMERIDMSREEKLMRLYLKGIVRQLQEIAHKKKAMLLQQQLLLQIQFEQTQKEREEEKQQQQQQPFQQQQELEFEVESLNMSATTFSDELDPKFQVNHHTIRKSKAKKTKQNKNKVKKSKSGSSTTSEIEFLRRTYGSNSISRVQLKSTYTGENEVDDLKRRLEIKIEEEKKQENDDEEEDKEEHDDDNGPQFEDGEKQINYQMNDKQEQEDDYDYDYDNDNDNDNDNDYDYGNDFDEIVEESKLHKLLV